MPTLILDSAEVREVGVGSPVECRAEVQHRHGGVVHPGNKLHAGDDEGGCTMGWRRLVTRTAKPPPLRCAKASRLVSRCPGGGPQNSRVVLKVVKAVMLQVLLASALSMKKRVTSSLAVVSAGVAPSGKEPLKLDTKAVSSDGTGYGMSGVSSALLATTPPSEKVST